MSVSNIVSIGMEQKNFMLAGCESAMEGVNAREGGPFGAAIARGAELVAKVHNTVLASCNPTCHAEMNAIRAACEKLGTEDLSDCVLYTSCEPCPMCWGGCQRAKIPVLYTGVDREIAAKYGFDDRFFYEEMERTHENRALPFVGGLLKDQVLAALSSTWAVRRVISPSAQLKQGLKEWAETEITNKAAQPDAQAREQATKPLDYSQEEREVFMKAALDEALKGMNEGKNKNFEVYGAVIVKDGQIVGRGYDRTVEDKNAVHSAVVVAITEACKTLGTYVLTGCTLFSTIEPDVMSSTSCYWARIDKIEFAISTQEAAYELGLVDQFNDFIDLHKNINDRQIKFGGRAFIEESENVFKHWQSLNGLIY